MHFVLLAILILINGAESLDPCDTNNILDFMEARFLDSARRDICDRFSIPSGGNWYRAEGQNMVSSAPFLNQTCGTQFPVWLKGSIPKTLHKVENSVACVAGARTDCDSTINIQIKNCGKYNVYFLKPPLSCPVAYCFEFTSGGRPTSEKTTKPKVKAVLVKKQLGRISIQELQFKCLVSPLTTDYFYQIQWFVDDKASFLAPAKFHHLLNEDTYLGEHENDDSLGYTRLGINVHCQVRLRINQDGPPGPASDRSDKLFAGIEITQSITVERGKEGIIEMKPTVPFGCLLNGDHPIDCNLTIEMFVPRDARKCDAEIKAKNAYYCAYQISNKLWNKPTHVLFEIGETGSYEINNPDGFRIGFKTQSRKLLGNIHWGDYILPEVHVHVTEKPGAPVWTGKHCHAYSDPHMRTFDGRPYDNQNSGKFILYRNRDHNFISEVHIEHTRCYFASSTKPFCVCAIGVRAGNDLFVIDQCPHRRLILGFKSCGESVLDARKVNEHEYKVFFPSGMYVQILMDGNYLGDKVRTMNINMYPSVNDEGGTLGLCGTLNGDWHDDYEDRNKGVVNNEKAFINAWRVRPSDDDLIGMTHEKALDLPYWPKKSVYCTCTADPKNPLPESAKLKSCSSSNMVECSKDENKKMLKRRCFIRHKRSLRGTFSYKPNNVVFDPTRRMKKVRRAAPITTWTKQKALQYCNDFMVKSVTFQACQAIPNTHPDTSVENCALDIMLTNTTDWADLSRRTLRMACMKELKDNNTLAEPAHNETVSIADKIKAISCPSDCSSHGICKNGTCTCDLGYGAMDCSTDLNAPPDVYGINIDDGGICDIGDCQSAFVEGDGFLDGKDLKCKLQYFEADMNNTVTFLHNVIVTGEHDSLAEVHCPIPNRGKRAITDNTDGFVHGYMISISNNNRNFSSSHPLYFLDGRCQDTVNISGSLGFFIRDNYCYVDASCHTQGTLQPYNKCGKCDSTVSQVSWTWVPGCTLTGSKTDQFSNGAIIGLSIGIIIFVLAFIAGGFTLHKLKRASKAMERERRNNLSSPDIPSVSSRKMQFSSN